MDEFLECVVSRDSDAMSVSLQLLAQSHERLHIASATNDLNDNIQSNAPCPLDGISVTDFSISFVVLGYELDQCFSELRI
jgi:hypothetical protein